MKETCLPAFLLMGIALGSASLLGCGSEQTESGTQVQVTDELQREAEASGDYLESQSKVKKSR